MLRTTILTFLLLSLVLFAPVISDKKNEIWKAIKGHWWGQWTQSDDNEHKVMTIPDMDFWSRCRNKSFCSIIYLCYNRENLVKTEVLEHKTSILWISSVNISL
jgi:hypothetical protein